MEQFHSLILAKLPIGYSRVDPEGRIIEFNEAAERITGYRKEEVLGRDHVALLHGPEARGCPLFDAMAEQKERVATNAAIITKGGEILYVSVTSFPLLDRTGAFLGGVEIFRDVTELKRLERGRKTLLSMFVHDMKSPMIAALGFLHRLLAGKNGSLTVQQETRLQHVRASLEKVERLVMDFLEYSRYEAKEYRPRVALLDLAALVGEQIEEVRLRAEEKGIALSYRGPSRLEAEGDAAMLARVVANLLDNAIRYTPERGAVTARLSEREGQLLLQVEDTGPGISADELPFVFDAFYRASRSIPGSGLGLAVAKSIAEAHQGRIWATSTPGRGTTVHLLLPFRQPGTPMDAPAPP